MYATKDDMTKAFGEEEMIALTNLDDFDGAIDETRLNAALEYAGAEIDSRLGARFALPLQSVPLVLKNKALDIARYQMEHGKPREDVVKRYDDAIRWLEQVAAGKVSLGDAIATPSTTPVEVIELPAYSFTPRVFSRETLWDY